MEAASWGDTFVCGLGSTAAVSEGSLAGPEGELAPVAAVQNSILENPQYSLQDPATWAELDGGVRTTSGARVNSRTAMRYPPWWRGINLISGDLARLDVHLYENGESRNVAAQHPAYRLLRRRPNKLMTALHFKRTMEFHALMWGNGYAAIYRVAGRPMELLLLNPVITEPMKGDDGDLYYTTRIGEEPVVLAASDVFHIKGLSADGIKGYPVLEVMSEPLGLGVAAREFGSRFFGQGTNASGFITVKGDPDEKRQLNILKDIKQQVGGLSRSHRIAILREGSEFHQISVTPEQAQFIETRKFEVKECALILGVPPHKLGDSERTSYNSLEQSNQDYLDEGLDPRLKTWEDEGFDKLLTEREKRLESHYFEFDRSALLRMNALDRYRNHAAGRQWGWLSANDVLRAENKKTIGPQGDRYLVPANMIDARAVPEIPSPASEKPKSANSTAADLLTAERAMIFDRLERLQTVEANAVKRAAAKEANFVAWLEEWYRDFSGKIADALQAEVRVVYARRELLPLEADGLTDVLAEEYCEAAKREFLDLAGSSTEATLAADVGRLVDGWGPERLERYVTSVLGE
jgi:HK97 family phage portal protein